MRSLAVYLKNYKKESILAPFFKFLEVVFDLIVPIVIAQIIDVGIANHDNGYIVQRFSILILMAALGLASTITAQFFAAKASVGFATELRQAVYDHVQHLSYTELDTLGTDTLITRLTDDVNQIQNGLNMGLRLLLRSPFIYLDPWSWHLPLILNVLWFLLLRSRFCFWLSLSLCFSVFLCLKRYRENWTQ